MAASVPASASVALEISMFEGEGATVPRDMFCAASVTLEMCRGVSVALEISMFVGAGAPVARDVLVASSVTLEMFKGASVALVMFSIAVVGGAVE